MQRPTRIAVIGSGKCRDQATADKARRLGELLAESGYEVLCGGLGGVMTAVCQGAQSRSGRTIGLVPGESRHDANEFVEVPIATSLGQMRNFLVVLNGDAVVAVDGGAGTLSEIGHALKLGRKVIVMGVWTDISGVIRAKDPEEAVQLVQNLLQNG